MSSLVNTAYKVLVNRFKRRLKKAVDQILGKYQTGLRRGRSVIENISALKEIIAESQQYNVMVHALFVDFRQT